MKGMLNEKDCPKCEGTMKEIMPHAVTFGGPVRTVEGAYACSNCGYDTLPY